MVDNRRHHPRIMLKTALGAGFDLQGQPVKGVQLDSIGLGGLGGWLDEGHLDTFSPEARIQNLRVAHPDFPSPAPELRVVFTSLGGQGGQPGRMVFGAQFLEVDDAFRQGLKAFLDRLIPG